MDIKAITEFSTVAEIKTVLDAHGISYKRNAKKAQLLKLIEGIRDLSSVEKENDVELVTLEDAQRYQYIDDLLSSNRELIRQVNAHLFVSQPIQKEVGLKTLDEFKSSGEKLTLPVLDKGEDAPTGFDAEKVTTIDPTEGGAIDLDVLTKKQDDAPATEDDVANVVDVDAIDEELPSLVEDEENFWERNKRNFLVVGIAIATFLITMFVLKYLV